MKVQEIQLCFENCEVCKLNPNMFKYLIIDGIKTSKKINCYQYENGEMQELKTCEYFNIEINEKGLNQLCWEDIPLKNRLHYNDITSVILKYDENKEEEIYVEWSNLSDFTNVYQKNTYDSDGNIRIEISKTEESEDKQ